MGAMAAGHLTLALLAYVALDFANPLMPGAVDLVAGSVAAVRPDRARTDDRTVVESPTPRGEPPAPAAPPRQARPVTPAPVPRRQRGTVRHRWPTSRPVPAPAADDH